MRFKPGSSFNIQPAGEGDQVRFWRVERLDITILEDMEPEDPLYYAWRGGPEDKGKAAAAGPYATVDSAVVAALEAFEQRA